VGLARRGVAQGYLTTPKPDGMIVDAMPCPHATNFPMTVAQLRRHLAKLPDSTNVSVLLAQSPTCGLSREPITDIFVGETERGTKFVKLVVVVPKSVLARDLW